MNRPDTPSEISVSELAMIEGFSVLAGGAEAYARTVGTPKIQRVGISLIGHMDNLVPTRVQLGRTEMSYLSKQLPTVRTALLEGLCRSGIPALAVTAGMDVPTEILDVCNQAKVALLLDRAGINRRYRHTQSGARCMVRAKEVRHAALIDVHGVGVLLLGKSGIGKSEIALELISRGHRLVADDVVILEKTGENTVVGHSPKLTRHHMEIRGLGIINIKDLYGVAAVRARKRVELAIQLVQWDELSEIDRLGLDQRREQFAGVDVPFISLPVGPGRSLSLIIEVAA